MYKTILVHVDGSAEETSRLRAAALLATEQGAHLIGSAATGFSWADFAILTGSLGAPLPSDDYTALRDAARARLQHFTEHAARLGVESTEVRLVDDLPDEGLLLQARYADLVVLSRNAGGEPGGARSHGLAARVALHVPRPVLVVPPSYDGQPLAGTVVVGWDGGTPALRAIAGALPLLRRAESVKLAVVNPDGLLSLHGEQPGADMALYLARQGVRVEVVVERTAGGVGDVLLGLSRESGAGLLVTGAYGHSRYREWVLGGVTQTVLDRTPLPVLMAH